MAGCELSCVWLRACAWQRFTLPTRAGPLQPTQAERVVLVLEGGAAADPGLQLNLLVLLGTLGEAAETTAQLVLDAGGLQQLLARAAPGSPPQLQEAAVDGVCKLCSSFAPAKDAAAAAGAIPALAALLGGGGGQGGGAGGGAQGSSSMDVTVRALLAIGMLVGGQPARQLELAGAPGAVGALLRLMRQQEDGDAQQIAAGLFRELASNAEAKGALAAALKEQQAADAEAAKGFV